MSQSDHAVLLKRCLYFWYLEYHLHVPHINSSSLPPIALSVNNTKQTFPSPPRPAPPGAIRQGLDVCTSFH
jgi:hypothetical protein